MKVIYYTKYGCSLCDEGLHLLRNFPALDIRIVDVEDDLVKYQSYLTRIPVITTEDGSKELSWPFTAEEIRKFIG